MTLSGTLTSPWSSVEVLARLVVCLEAAALPWWRLLRTVVRPGRWCTSHTAEVAAGARYTALPLRGWLCSPVLHPEL